MLKQVPKVGAFRHLCCTPLGCRILRVLLHRADHAAAAGSACKQLRHACKREGASWPK